MTVQEPSYWSPKWSAKCGSNKFTRFNSAHHPLKISETPLSKVATMVRPTQARLLSGYLAELHDCYTMRKTDLSHRWVEHGRKKKINQTTLTRYADCVRSCTTNMLVGEACPLHDGSLQLSEALERVQNLGFVGLTDQWDLSICLWHAKFGGECLPSEFINTRPGKKALPDGDGFEGAFKSPDDAIYQKARQMFVESMRTYEVTPESCANRYCPRVAHLFGGESPNVSSIVIPSEQDGLDWLTNLTWPGRMLYDED